MNKIRFLKYYVTDGNIKARVQYAGFRSITLGCDVVALYAKSHNDSKLLHRIFPVEYINDTSPRDDSVCIGRVRLKNDHPLYQSARERADQWHAILAKTEPTCN